MPYKLTLKIMPIALFSAMSMTLVQADTWSSLQGNKNAPVKAMTSDRMAANQLLFTEIETLKQEIQSLMSKVEEQDFEIKKLKIEQKERYLDLDRRISQLLKSSAQSTQTKSTVQGKDQYDLAFNLMKSQKLNEAVTAFNRFLKAHPKSSLVVNGYYWLGQIYYNQANLDEARKAFTIVVNQFPKHQKALDSKYKLGVVLHRLGDDIKAKKILKALIKEHAGSASARFAKKYLKENL